MNSDNLYKTGSDMRIFISVIGNGQPMWVDDCLGLSYSENTQKTPIFGYASKFFDAVAEGPTLITGSFTIAARGARTLAALRRYAQIVNSYSTDIDELKDKYWKRQTISNTISTGQSYPYLETSAPLMNIAIVYGGYDENNDFEVTSSKVIRYVYINNSQEGFAQDDSPLVRTFSFIARTIENDFNIGTISGRRSAYKHVGLRKLSTDVYRPCVEGNVYPRYDDIGYQDVVLPIYGILNQDGTIVPQGYGTVDQDEDIVIQEYGIMEQQPVPVPTNRVGSIMDRLNDTEDFATRYEDMQWRQWTGGTREEYFARDRSSESDIQPDTISEAVEQIEEREDEHNTTEVTTNKVTGEVRIEHSSRDRR